MTQEIPNPLPIEPNYELSPEELTLLTTQLIAERAKDVPEKHRRITIEVGADEPYSNIARHIEQVVFKEYYGDDDLDAEFKPFEQASRFFISVDRKEIKATGAIRAIKNSPAGFEAIRDLTDEFGVPEGEWLKKHDVSDLDKVWDIATLAVLPEYRQGTVSLQLFRAVYKSAVENHDIEHFVAILDKDALSKLERFFGVAFQRLAGSEGGPYHNSEWSQPVYGYLPELFMIARHRMESPLIGKAASRAAEVLVMGEKDESLVLEPKT